MFKFINIFFWIFLIIGCSTNTKDYKHSFSEYNISVETPSDRYNTLLRYELNKVNSIFDKQKKSLRLKIEINFYSDSALTLKGLNPLYNINGTITYKLIDNNDRLINEGKLISKVNYGSIKSLYGKEENEKHIKERIVKRLSLKLLNKIKLIINKIEN